MISLQRAAVDSRISSEAVLVAIQGGYLLSTGRLDARPMRTALDAAYEQLRASR